MVTGLEKEQEYATLAIFFLSLNKNSQLKLMSYSPLFRSIFFVAENGLEKAKEKAILVIATLSKDKKNHQLLLKSMPLLQRIVLTGTELEKNFAQIAIAELSKSSDYTAPPS